MHCPHVLACDWLLTLRYPRSFFLLNAGPCQQSRRRDAWSLACWSREVTIQSNGLVCDNGTGQLCPGSVVLPVDVMWILSLLKTLSSDMYSVQSLYMYYYTRHTLGFYLLTPQLLFTDAAVSERPFCKASRAMSAYRCEALTRLHMHCGELCQHSLLHFCWLQLFLLPPWKTEEMFLDVPVTFVVSYIVSFLITRLKTFCPCVVRLALVWVKRVFASPPCEFANADWCGLKAVWRDLTEATTPCSKVRAYIHTYCVLNQKINCSAHIVKHCDITCSCVPHSCDTDLHDTFSFGQQLSVCAGDLSHVLEVWLAHIFPSGGFTGQGGCHACWAHGWGRCAAGVQGSEQEVGISAANEYDYISVPSPSCLC